MKIDWKIAFLCWIPLALISVIGAYYIPAFAFNIGQVVGGLGMILTMKFWLKF